jgi:hypothetical protein
VPQTDDASTRAWLFLFVLSSLPPASAARAAFFLFESRVNAAKRLNPATRSDNQRRTVHHPADTLPKIKTVLTIPLLNRPKTGQGRRHRFQAANRPCQIGQVGVVQVGRATGRSRFFRPAKPANPTLNLFLFGCKYIYCHKLISIIL